MRIAIYPNVTKSGAGEILERVIKFANQYNIELLLPPKEGKFFYHEELINQNIEKEYIDMAISIGGDGTLLGLCRRLAKNGIPVCGINIGHLGFLADIEPGEIEAKLTKIIPLKIEFSVPERYASQVKKGTNLNFELEGKL